MDMRLFSLAENGAKHSVKLEIKIIGSLNGFADNDISFNECSSLKELFTGLSGALKDSEFILIAVESGIYNKAKVKLLNALSLKTEIDAGIMNLMSLSDLSQQEKESNATIPVGATVFASNDGICSGFAVKKGKQTIAFIPSDNTRTDYVLKRGLIPYITNGGKLVLNEIEPAPKQEEKIVESTDIFNQDDSGTYSNSDCVQRTINILRESDVTVSVNGNANSIVMRDLGEKYPGFSDYFTFTPHIEDRGDYNVTDYTAQMAKSAKGLSNSKLGACVSDIFSTDECDFICIAVATDKSALVRKLYKEADETDEQFIQAAAEELFALIGEKASGNNAVGIEIAQEEVQKPNNFFKTKKGKITISVISIVLVAAIVVSVLFFVKNKNNQEEITTTVPVETTAEPTTQAIANTETMLLSQLIRYEVINGIKDKKEETTVPTTVGAIGNTTKKETTTQAASVETPSVITVNGKEIDAKEAIARIVEAEMDKSYSVEAVKAQAVVTYTYLKYRDTNWVINGVTLVDSYSQEIYDAVSEVFGKYLTYNSQVAFTPYCLMSAGKTASSQQIFGVKYDYLKSVDSLSDKQRDNYKQDTLISADEIKTYVESYDSSIKLGEDVSKWLSIETHDTAVSTGTGYVEKVKVGDKEISGTEFIFDLMKEKNLVSACFSLTYNSNDKTYTITTFGSGYGVGLSLKGADKLAISGTKFDKILDKYYPGTILA